MAIYKYIEKSNDMDTAILVGASTSLNVEQIEKSLDELRNLAETLMISTKDIVSQKLNKINTKFYIGKGKLQDLKMKVDALDINIVIFDDPLSPTQLRNLENFLDCQVYDRSFLILSIFALRAQSYQSKLEVELAQKKYMLPRLIPLEKSLSRQGGGTYNAKGPGETKLETDRRTLAKDIVTLENRLDKIKQQLKTEKKKRLNNKIPKISLIGYTNAGKSSLMNALSSYFTGIEENVVEEKNMLFTTLSTKHLRLKEKDKIPFILADTVGFINKIPNELVNSFESTLLDMLDSDLIIHVVDGTNFSLEEIETTKQIIKNINADNIERFMVLTKKDISYLYPNLDEDFIFISNHTKENIDLLVSNIYNHLYKYYQIKEYLIPFDKGHLLNDFKNNNHIIDFKYQDGGIYVKLLLSIDQINNLDKILK